MHGSDGTSDAIAGLGRALYEFMSTDGGTTVLMHPIRQTIRIIIKGV